MTSVMTFTALTFTALATIPEINSGDGLAGLIAASLDREELKPQAQDVLVIAQKAVSKAEGRFVNLGAVVPSSRAKTLGAETDKDPRLVETILSESESVLRSKPGVIVVVHRLGLVMANAGIDASNLSSANDQDTVLLLPEDPDGSADALLDSLTVRYGVPLGIVISDSFGRPWRQGVVNVALGSAGLPSLIDARGRLDRAGRPLRVTEIAFADALAAGAGLVMGEADEGRPVVLVRGVHWDQPPIPAQALIRPEEEDMFR
jgi:coenzyme F420-0:L-glutamate ligase / coenzyme F420-1:gamma-L-glutamate ligase